MSSEAAVLEAPAAPAAIPQAPVAATPPPTPEPATIHTFERDVGQLAPDALSRLMPSPKPLRRAGTPPPATPVVAPVPALVVPQAPAVVVVPEAPAPVVAPEPAKNWRLQAKDAKEAMMMQLVKNGASMPDAYTEVYGQPTAPVVAPAQPISEPTPQVSPTATFDAQITTLAQEVANLTAQADKAAEDGDTKTAFAAQRKLTDKTIALERVKDQREAARSQTEDRQVFAAVERHRQLEQASFDRMFANYPELADVASERRAQVNLKVKEMEADPAFGPKFRDSIPGWPEMVARMVHAEKGWAKEPAPALVAAVPALVAPKPMSQPPPLVPAQLPVPPVRATSAEVITPSTTPGGTTATLNAQTFWEHSKNTDPDVLIKMMGRAPIDPRLLQKQKSDPRRFGA